jgi:hypothetical protein
MIIRRAAGVVCALLLCTSLAFAQAANQNNIFSSTLTGGINLRSIPGAPFSADVTKESVKVLPDGTSTPAVTRGKMFRDAEGRIRSEMEIVSVASATVRRSIVVVDPVAKMSMVLDPQTKTATLIPLPSAPASAALTADKTEKISAKARAIVGAQDLGASMLQGFNVTGSRRTRPVSGTNGEKTQAVTVETWFSPELKVELQARTEWANGNAATTRLENIVVAEPDRALFEPPADYTVKTIPASK